jgi:hypothetical protein
LGIDLIDGSQAGMWNYAQHFTYNALGAVTAVQLGKGRWESTRINSRLQNYRDIANESSVSNKLNRVS